MSFLGTSFSTLTSLILLSLILFSTFKSVSTVLVSLDIVVVLEIFLLALFSFSL